MSTSSSPVECRAAVPVLEAWVGPVLKQHLHVLEEKGAGAGLAWAGHTVLSCPQRPLSPRCFLIRCRLWHLLGLYLETPLAP